MNRPAVRELLAPGTQVAPGEVLVPTEVGDPVRGAVPCPAAPLVGGSLLRRGKRVSYAPVGPCVDPSDDEGGAAVFVATACSGTSRRPPWPQRPARWTVSRWRRPGRRWRNGPRSSGPAGCWPRRARGATARHRRSTRCARPWPTAARCTCAESWRVTRKRSRSWRSKARSSSGRWARSRTEPPWSSRPTASARRRTPRRRPAGWRSSTRPARWSRGCTPRPGNSPAAAMIWC